MPSDAVLCTLDALVAGGGPAGASVATRLAETGRSVVLLEKSRGPTDRMCGEFLSREAVLYLQRLGLDAAALGAVPITHLRLSARTLVAEVSLPFHALSLTRRVLDQALLARAEQAGATVLPGEGVEALRKVGTVWLAETATGRTFRAHAAFLATGKHDLRGWPRGPGRQNHLVAFKMYFELSAAEALQLAQHVELHVFPGGYAGLQPVERGRANLCLLVTRAQLTRCGSRWQNLFITSSRAARRLYED